MSYFIGEVSNKTGISVSTLRYYDKEGLFQTIKRSDGGIRIFADDELEIIKIIQCLKSTGMPIRDIKQFFDWCNEGDSSLEKRLNMFNERLEIVENQMKELQKTIDIIKYKCWYYRTAVDAGTEEIPKSIAFYDMPEEVQKCKSSMN